MSCCLTPKMISVQERAKYYRAENVRARILEFLGGGSVEKPTSRYLTVGDEERPRLDERWSDRRSIHCSIKVSKSIARFGMKLRCSSTSMSNT